MMVMKAKRGARHPSSIQGTHIASALLLLSEVDQAEIRDKCTRYVLTLPNRRDTTLGSKRETILEIHKRQMRLRL